MRTTGVGTPVMNCGNSDCIQCPPLSKKERDTPRPGSHWKRHKVTKGLSPRPWRVNKENEIIDAQGNTVAWGYHEDFGALLQQIRRADALLIVRLINRYKGRKK